MGIEDGGRETTGFATANEVVAQLEGHIPVGGVTLGGEEPGTAGRSAGEEFVEILPHPHGDVFPVIETGTANVLVLEGEAQRLDQMQGGTGRQAEPARSSGVVRDFGCDEDQVKHGGRGEV